MDIRCPKCKSDQITANKKGFNISGAVVGDILLGPIGIIAGSKNQHKVVITCLSCGHSWNAGALQRAKAGRLRTSRLVDVLIVFGIILMPWIFAWFALRKGVSTTVRVISFGWMIMFFVFALWPHKASADELWRVRPNEVYSPDTYCNWNRTGLPREQQRICDARDKRDIAGQTRASKNLMVFETVSGKAMKTLALVHAAGQCGFRSDGWVETFNTAFAIATDADIRTFRLSDSEIRTANQVANAVYVNTISHVKCNELANSPTLDHLDGIHRKLTNGYQ